MFTFFKEVKSKNEDFIKHITDLEIPNGISLFHSNLDEDVIYLKMATDNDENDVYGAMKLNHIFAINTSYYFIEKVATTEKHRKKGIATILYKFIVELGLSFMTDSTHTTFGSKDLWQKFPEYFPDKNIYILNIKTRYKRKYTTQHEHTIWGKQSDEDFDFLEKEDKIYLLEELYLSDTITKKQRDYFIKNIEFLSDKSNVRLVIE